MSECRRSNDKANQMQKLGKSSVYGSPKDGGDRRRIMVKAIPMKSCQPRNRHNLFKNQSGEGYIDVAVMVLCVMIVIALGTRVFPIFITKIQMDNFADELVRAAEISGRVGIETTARQQVLAEKTGLNPSVLWSRTGDIQLNEEVTVTVSVQKDLGLFGGFGSFPVTIRARASGKSEVYHK